MWNFIMQLCLNITTPILTHHQERHCVSTVSEQRSAEACGDLEYIKYGFIMAGGDAVLLIYLGRWSFKILYKKLRTPVLGPLHPENNYFSLRIFMT